MTNHKEFFEGLFEGTVGLQMAGERESYVVPLTGVLPAELKARATERQQQQFRELCIQCRCEFERTGKLLWTVWSVISLCQAIDKGDPRWVDEARKRRNRRKREEGLCGRAYGLVFQKITVLTDVEKLVMSR